MNFFSGYASASQGDGYTNKRQHDLSFHGNTPYLDQSILPPY
jgi:hypothetical protein